MVARVEENKNITKKEHKIAEEDLENI